QTEGTDPTTVTAVAGVDTDAGNDGYYLPADLTITKSGQPGIVMAGDVLTYTLVYTNLSSADAQDVYITDTLPVSVTFGSVVSENPSISGPTVAGRFLTWFTPTLAASVSGQIVFTVTTNADANPFVYNTVVITTTTPDSNPDNNDDDEITFVSVPGQSDLAISKSVNPNVVVAGQVITYTLIYGNNGIAEAQAVYITDTLPAGVTFGGVVSENPALSGPTQTGQSLTWHTPTLTIGASGSIVFTATVNSGVSGTITNMVSITTTTPDSDPTNNQDDAPTTVPTPGLLLTPDNSGVGQPGQTLTYTHILTNTGDITDTYLITWTYTNGFTTTVNTTSVTLPPGGSTVLTVPVTIPPTATSGDTSTATITATSTVNPGLHDTVYDTTTVETPGMVVEKLVSLARVAPHQEVTYTIRITNTGDITLTTVRVVDTLPPGFTYVAGSGVPTPDSITGGQLVWNDASAGAGLTPGQTTDVIFRATMPTTTDTYINTAAVTGTHPTGVITDSDTAPVVVTDPAVEVAKNTVPPGATDGLITFTIRITNIGPSTLNQVPLVDHFTGPVVYVGGSPAADTVDNVNQVVDWDDLTVNFGRDLAPNQSFVLTTVFSLTTHSTTFTMTNVATVTNALDVYSNTANDDSDAALVVNQPTAIQLLYFNAVRSGAWVNLNWATAVELDNYGFRLLRSATGSLADATEIAFVPGQGYGTASGATYTFTDKTAAADQAYTYWLVDVDVNGVETRHNPVTVDVVDIDQGGNHTIFLPLIFKH
ncbi:MAG: DUF11 domain-containing protein, partial [Anaerolineae bacterium]|nr:DUF11 domain-containing protein [Anaerolineae bacterium]